MEDDSDSERLQLTLPLRLQQFGINSGHQQFPDYERQLKAIVYDDIVFGLSHDPFFPEAKPNFSAPLSSQQGCVEGAEYSESARGRPCGHVFGKGETVYRCRNCGMDDTCVLCQKCYKASNHEGHDVAMSINGGSGGCCDCGDPEAWRLEMCCKYHFTKDKVETREQPIVETAVLDRVRATVASILDFILDVMSHAKESARPPSLDDETNPKLDAARSRLTGERYNPSIEAALEASWSTVLWNDEKHTFDEVIDIVRQARGSTKAYGRQIAKLVDTRGRATVYCGSLTEAMRIASHLSRIRLGVTVRASRDVFREDMVETLIMFLQDIASLFIIAANGMRNTEAMRRIICEEMCDQWRQGVVFDRVLDGDQDNVSVVTDNEDEEDEDEMDDIGEDENEAEEEDEDNNIVDQDGRPEAQARPAEPQMDQERLERIALLTPRQRAVLLTAHNLARRNAGFPEQTAFPLPIDAGNPTIVQNDNDTDQEDVQVDFEVGGEVQTIVLPNVFNRPDMMQDIEASNADLREDEQAIGVVRRNMHRSRKRYNPPHWHTDRSRFVHMKETRLAHLFLQDLKLWKLARAGLRELYITTMVVIPYFKKEMGIRFAVAYTHLAEAFLFADREPEQSMILFSVQIFTVPSIAAILVDEYDFLTTLLAVCYTYYSQHKIGVPSEVDTNALQTLDVYKFKSKRHYHVVDDVRYLLGTAAVKKIIPRLLSVQLQFLDWLELFQGQNPQLKATIRHVEYETTSWTDAFNVTMQIAKHAQMFARTFENAQRSPERTKDQLLSILDMCAARLRAWNEGSHLICRPRFEPRAPVKDYISLHHPLHWLLVGLATHLTKDDDVSFMSQDTTSTTEAFALARYPLRVIHMTWEIRCNLWVRNGHSIRVQLHYYTDVDSREFCIDKDIQFVQMYLASAGPSLRFDRKGLFSSVDAVNSSANEYIKHFERHDPIMKTIFETFESVPEAGYTGNDTNLLHMQNYMFHFFIVLFSERQWLRNPSNQENIARALRHGLIFGPKTYSEISKLVTDDRGDEACFDLVLDKLADYRPPSGLEDVGRYALKREEYAKVDPYYHHYTLQQIEEANEILTKAQNDKNAIIECSLEPIDEGPWSGIVDFVCCPSLQEYIVDYFTCLRRSAMSDVTFISARESITDKVLQLLILATQEEHSRRLRGAITLNWGVFPFPCADFFLQNDLTKDQDFKVHHPKLAVLRQRLLTLNGENLEPSSSTNIAKREYADDELEIEEKEFLRKKALAKARQAKLMNDMRASQNAFMDSNKVESFVSDGHLDEEMDDADKASETRWTFPAGNCMICQNIVGGDGEAYGVLGCIQDSRLDRTTPSLKDFPAAINDIIDHGPVLDQQRNWHPTHMSKFPTQFSKSRNTITSCAHVMHWDCYFSWFEGIKTQHHEWSIQGRNLPMRIEFQCPLCKTVGNTFLPIFSKTQGIRSTLQSEERVDYDASLSELQNNDVFNVIPSIAGARLAEHLTINKEFTHRIQTMVAAQGRSSNNLFFSNSSPPVMPEATIQFERRCQYYQRFSESLSEHSALLVGDDNYSLPGEGQRVFTNHISILTASICDVEISLRDRSHNDNKTTPVSTLVEGLSEQNLTSLRVQANFLQAQLALGFYNLTLDEMISNPEGLHGSWGDGLVARREARLAQLFPFRKPLLDNRKLDLEEIGELLESDLFSVFVELSMITAAKLSTIILLANTLLQAEMLKALLAYRELDLTYLSKNTVIGTPLMSVGEEEVRQFGMWQANILNDPHGSRRDVELLALYGVLQMHALVFVRKVAIFLNTVMGVKLSETPGPGHENELDRLTSAIGMTDLKLLFSGLEGRDPEAFAQRRLEMCQSWCRAPYWRDQPAERCRSTLSYPLPCTLARLPESLDEMFEQCLKYKCPRCKTVPERPALCLVCGTILCFQSQCCWNEMLGAGECSSHRSECSGSVGLFLVVKRSALLIMRRDGGSFGPAPYLDIHGEPDPDLRRGKPQFLNERRYEAGVRQMYLQHQIPTWLARQMESMADMGGWETL